MPIKGRFCERKLAKKRSFARGSFRWVHRGSNWLLVGCPRGKWRRGPRRCKVGTRAYALLVASKTGRCRGGRLVRKG